MQTLKARLNAKYREEEALRTVIEHSQLTVESCPALTLGLGIRFVFYPVLSNVFFNLKLFRKCA